MADGSRDSATWRSQQILKDAEVEERDRLVRYQAAWKAYHGGFDKPLKIEPAKNGAPPIDDNVLLPWTREVIDEGVDWLFGDPPEIEYGDRDAITTPQEDYLEQVWRTNSRSTTLTKLALNGGVCGHAFIKIVPRDGDPLAPRWQPTPVSPQGAEDDPDAPTPTVAPASPPGDTQALILPRLIVLDPANVRVYWESDDIDDVWRYEIAWVAIGRDGKPRLMRQVIERAVDRTRWTLQDQESNPDGGPWIDVGPEVPWPHPFAPIVDCQNLVIGNEYYGLADVEAIMLDLNRAGNARASDLARINRIHAHPKVWTAGLTDDQVTGIDFRIDGVTNLPDDEASLNLLEMTGEAATSLEYLRFLSDEFRKAGRAPELTPEKLKSLGDLSGKAMKILFAPRIAITKVKRSTYGDLLKDLNRRLLAMAGLGDYHTPVEIRWGELVPSDPKEEAEVASAKQAAGVSRDTTLREMGYDPDDEAAKGELEAAAAAEQLAREMAAGTDPNDPPGSGF